MPVAPATGFPFNFHWYTALVTGWVRMVLKVYTGSLQFVWGAGDIINDAVLADVTFMVMTFEVAGSPGVQETPVVTVQETWSPFTGG